MKKKRIAIIGAGVMGSATALELARCGYEVIVKDISVEQLEKAKGKVENDYRFAQMYQKGYTSMSLDDIFAQITFQDHYEQLELADIVIENIHESFEDKVLEYQRLANIVKEDTLFALNTSCISITKLASYLPDSSKVIGIHLMNPVPLKKMVEVIRGHHTSKETEEEIVAFLKTLDKLPIVIDDLPGFVSNRLSHLLMNEAAFIVQDGIASVEQVDAIMKQGFYHKMGPLETADLIGLDTVVDSLRILYESYQDTKFRCCPLLQKMVDAGQLGRKSGQGFYSY